MTKTKKKASSAVALRRQRRRDGSDSGGSQHLHGKICGCFAETSLGLNTSLQVGLSMGNVGHHQQARQPSVWTQPQWKRRRMKSQFKPTSYRFFEESSQEKRTSCRCVFLFLTNSQNWKIKSSFRISLEQIKKLQIPLLAIFLNGNLSVCPRPRLISSNTSPLTFDTAAGTGVSPPCACVAAAQHPTQSIPRRSAAPSPKQTAPPGPPKWEAD